MNELKRGEPCSGRPVETAIPENIEKVHDMILNDKEIVEAIWCFYTSPAAGREIHLEYFIGTFRCSTNKI